MDTLTAAVVGAGTIGRGVAQSLAEHGWTVKLVDSSQGQLERAMAQISQDLDLFQLYRPTLALDAGAVVDRIHPGTDLQAAAACELVVENVTESWSVKRQVHRELDEICDSTTLLGINTSAIPITKVAAEVSCPERVVGLHFMNPVPLMNVVEVMRGTWTSEDVVERTRELLQGLGKRAVVINDAPGFVANRVYMPTINEAVYCVFEGVATAEQVDEIFRGCFGHKMGPLETADLIGLDTVLNSLVGMYESFKDSKYRPCPLLQRMVDAGLHGRKTDRGFYDYRQRHSVAAL
jgi:3-hydroxybutyryl-CoA dehydrogenase